jgi:hypothetical protein
MAEARVVAEEPTIRRRETLDLGGQQYILNTQMPPGSTPREMIMDPNTTILRPDGTTIAGGGDEAMMARRDLVNEYLADIERRRPEEAEVARRSGVAGVVPRPATPEEREERATQEVQQWVGRRVAIAGEPYWVELPREVAARVTGNVAPYLAQARIYEVRIDRDTGEPGRGRLLTGDARRRVLNRAAGV